MGCIDGSLAPFRSDRTAGGAVSPRVVLGGLGYLGSADNWVKTRSWNDFKCWAEVDEYLPTTLDSHGLSDPVFTITLRMANTRSGGRGSRGGGGGSRRAGANNNNSNAGNNNNNAGNNNANAAEQQAVAAALAEVNAGDPAEAANYQNVRNALTTNGGFPNAVGGATDKFLLSAGGLFRDQQTLARSVPNEIDAAVTAHNRQNKGFGQGITPQHSSLLHGFAHVFRLERSGGRPLDQARLQALVPTLTSQTIIDAGEKLKEVQEIKEGPQPQFADMVLGEG
ncbi:hypothetical protein THAOC_08229 [Thalassiosira oceanica]|uniref:Uncharacterized protein n=1 Tax=Thalassiosira oceanica TaxID=159749 RepID=K0TAG3_THAOC|nr:hypothetical protein THAOC_08229 [Thalassiosira oceanica]|eukprot:EJK70416.1 hypothetical protein THAOC_08229 [Thalassiosira oceanica]